MRILHQERVSRHDQRVLPFILVSDYEGRDHNHGDYVVIPQPESAWDKEGACINRKEQVEEVVEWNGEGLHREWLTM